MPIVVQGQKFFLVAGHGRAGQGRAGQGSRAGQGKKIFLVAGQGRAGQDMAGRQGRAGQKKVPCGHLWYIVKKKCTERETTLSAAPTF
jgi:hypothetical protein